MIISLQQVASSESSAQPFSFLERLGSKRRSKRKKEEEKSSEQVRTIIVYFPYYSSLVSRLHNPSKFCSMVVKWL